MTITPTNRGAGGNAVTATTLTCSPTTTIAAGALAILAVVYDNSGTSGADPFASIARDSTGEWWSMSGPNGAAGTRQSPGNAANDGLVMRYFVCLRKQPMTSSDSVVLTLSPTTAVKEYVFTEFVTDQAGKVCWVVGDTIAQGTAGTAVSVTRSITSGNCALGITGGEQGGSVTADSDTTNGSWSSSQGASDGGTGTGQCIQSQTKVVSSTGNQTYNTTLANATDWIGALIEVTEMTTPFIAPVVGGGAAASTANASTYASGNFVPMDGALLVVLVAASDTLQNPGVVTTNDGSGPSFVLGRGPDGGGASVAGLWGYVSNGPMRGVLQAVTFDCTGDAATGASIGILQIIGMRRFGSGAIRNSGGAAHAAGGTPGTGGLQRANQAPWLIIAQASNASNPAALTPPTGYTEVLDTGYATPTIGHEVAYRNGGDTSSQVGGLSWGGTSATAGRAFLMAFGDIFGPTILNQAVKRAASW